jgi:putative transposase
VVQRMLFPMPLIFYAESVDSFYQFFDGRAQYPTFTKRQGRQSMQYPQNVKILSNSSIKFPENLGIVKAKIHRDAVGKLRTVTVSRMPDGRYSLPC